MKALAWTLAAALVAVMVLLGAEVWKHGYHLNYGPPAGPARNGQVEKNLWYICTPDGWRQIETSAPVRIWDVTATPGIHPLTPGPYVLGPFSPAQTFTTKWGKYPAAHCD